MLKKNAGRQPGVFLVVFRQAPKNSELLINRDPKVPLDVIHAALAIKVREDAIDGEWRHGIKDVVDTKREGRVSQ